MILHVIMKTPDALEQAIRDLALSRHPGEGSLATEERNAFAEDLRDRCARWFRHGESVVLEIDTDTNTCRALENGR